MKERATPYTQFGRKLDQELRAQNVSVRELARRMRPEDSETMRRSIIRWLAPDKEGAVSPSEASRRSVGEALNLPEGDLDDDEEADPVASLSLDDFLRRRVVSLMREEQEARA